MGRIARVKFVPPTRFEFETFRPMSSWWQIQMTQENPDCFNGIVRIRKWRIVAEQLPEPTGILVERLLRLWAANDNSHNWRPMSEEAKRLGIVLP